MAERDPGTVSGGIICSWPRLSRRSRITSWRSRPDSGRSWTRFSAIRDHLDPLQGDHAVPHHLVQEWQDGLDLLRGVHDLDHDRQVLAEAQDLRGVDAALGAEPHHPAKNRRARETRLARLR